MKFKAKVYVRLRAAVDDSAGNAVRDACSRLSDLKMQIFFDLFHCFCDYI